MALSSFRLKCAASAISAILSISLAPSGAAQEYVDDSTVVYPSGYFEQYNPVTAQDMLNRIPGISSPTGGGFGGGGGGGRGLGGGGGDQLLINGKRVAGKDNSAQQQLTRITADKVSHFEIIRGTSAQLDVRGSNQVVNVVLHEELTSSSVSYEINADHYRDGHVQPGGKLAWNRQSEALNIVASLEAEPRHDPRVSFEQSVQGDYSPNDLIHEERTRRQTDYGLSTSLSYDINASSSARLNMLYRQNDDPTRVERRITDLTDVPPTVLLEREDIPGERDSWEVGGDYQYNFDSGSRFRILFIANRGNQESTRERFVEPAGEPERKNLFLARSAVDEERIVRTSFTRGLGERQDLEAGIERAWTGLDSSLRLGQPSEEGVPSEEYGGLVPVDLPIADSVVEEVRYEPFVVHNWQMNPRMSLESTLIYEASEITQSGDVRQQRDFGFLKPKLDWRFNVSPALQLRASAQRIVRQLSFSDFVATSDENDDDSDTQAGNENLEQEKVHLLDARFEYRLPQDAGVIDGRLFYMQHLDVIEYINVAPEGSPPRSARGNIGDGEMYGMSLNGSLRMTALDLPGLLLNAQLTVQDSRITDPFLGIERRFERYERGRFQLGFRHDVTRYNVSYGLNWNNRFDGNMKSYDVNTIESYSGDPNVTVFAEVVAFGGVRFRLDARNATAGYQCRERLRYDGLISTGDITEIEKMCATSGSVVALKISGTL